jgi:hypothetical protein
MLINKASRGAYSIAIAAAVAAFVSAGSAKADTFTIVGGSSYTLHNFDVSGLPGGVGNGTSVTAFTSSCSNCGLEVNPGTTSLTFTFLGKEAGDVNNASTVVGFNNITLFTNGASAGTSVTESYTLGSGNNFLPFGFTDTTGSDQSAVFSLTWPYDGSSDSFSHGSDVSLAFYKLSNTAVLAFFDDKNGGNQDHDYDDMVVEIQFTADINPNSVTPLPAALPLFAGGLGTIGLFLRGRKRKAAAAV